MNRQELASALAVHHVPPDAYDLNGGLPSERYVLEENGDGTWSVFYSERGRKVEERTYPSESDACDSFLSRILRDLHL